MTITEKIKKLLTENGLFDNQADEVVEICEDNEELFYSFKGRWNEDESAYPEMIINIL